MKKIGFLLVAVSLLAASAASAISVDVNGINTNVNTSPSGVNVNVGGTTVPSTNVNVNRTPTGVNVNTNVNGQTTNTQVNRTTSGVNVNTSANGQSVNVNRTGSNLNVNANGQTVNINNPTQGAWDITANGNKVMLDGSGDPNTLNISVNGRNVQVQTNQGLTQALNVTTSDPNARKTIVSLEGSSISLINSNEDVNAYAQLVVQERPSVRSVNIEDNGIRVQYVQPARCLGFIKANWNATAKVDNQGNVNVKLPWYNFLCSKNTKTIVTQIQNGLTMAQQNNRLNLNFIGNGSIREGNEYVNANNGTLTGGDGTAQGTYNSNTGAASLRSNDGSQNASLNNGNFNASDKDGSINYSNGNWSGQDNSTGETAQARSEAEAINIISGSIQNNTGTESASFSR